jgi:excisionase family DNA binding protein|tara:strand:+ start:793 stop:981 length:189 start_codon:yes stop_codon:yes gene_type:complete
VNSEKLTLTVKETAQLLGLSRNSAYQGVLTGEIPHIKVGKRILIPRLALERILAEAGKSKES